MVEEFALLCYFIPEIFSGIFYERKVLHMMNKNVKVLVKIGVLSAIAYILQFLGSVIGINVGGFLTVEISDLPALLGCFALGPVAGVVIELIKNILHCAITSTGFVGEFANFTINGLFVLTAGLIYKYNRTLKGAVLGMIVGTLVMTLSAMLINLYVMLPMYMGGADFGARLNIVIYTITPFNFCRGIVLSLITLVLYKRLRPIL